MQDKNKTYQVIGGLAGGGLALGLALAFLVELYLDRSFKRPQEVAAKLKLPFFLAVPYLNGNGKLRLPKIGKKVKLLPANTGGPAPAAEAKGSAPAPAQTDAVTPRDAKQALQPFHETLRDRLVAYFEMINLTHKPKLVAVTSCDEGAGVSTMASGLAVLPVRDGGRQCAAGEHELGGRGGAPFLQGQADAGAGRSAGKGETGGRDGAGQSLCGQGIQPTADKLPIVLPKRFGHLVSKMKASDYDYIIFDMPPVTQISVTPRLARFMDMVLLVMESGKTDRDMAQRAARC